MMNHPIEMRVARNKRRTASAIPCYLAVLFLCNRTVPAQEEPRTPPQDLGITSKEPATPTSKADVDVQVIVQKARTLIDDIDANHADAPSRESLQELEKLIEDIRESDPANPWLPYLLGRAYGLAGRNGDAIDQIRKFVQTREGRNEWKAHQVLGDMFVGEFPRLAKASYDKAAELSPNEPSVLIGLSNCATRAGNLDEGIRLARLAVDADAYKNVRYANRLARALMARQQWDDAEKVAVKALEIAEGRVRNEPGQKSAVQTLTEQYNLLIELISGRITSSATVDPQAYIRLADLTGDRADIMVRLAKHDQVAILENAITRTAPDTPMVVRLQYAAYLADAGRVDDAIAEYEKIVAAEPDNKAAAEALAQLRSESDRKKSNPAP